MKTFDIILAVAPFAFAFVAVAMVVIPMIVHVARERREREFCRRVDEATSSARKMHGISNSGRRR